MKDLGEHNREWLTGRSADDLAEWLELALRSHADTGDPFAFSPLNDTVATAETIAAGVAIATEALEPTFAVRLRQALALLVRRWPADDRQTWAVLVELAWRLQAPDAIELLEARCSPAFLDSLFQNDARFFSDVLAFSRQTIAFGHSAAVQFIYRLVGHRLFADSDARLTLMSLCERDPVNLHTHLAVLREQLHNQACRIESRKGFVAKDAFHRELALHILSSVGFENFKKSIPLWYILSSSDSEQPTDNWLLEKMTFVVYVKLGLTRLFVAPLEAPSNLQVVENVPVLTIEQTAGDLGDPDFALGVSRVPEPAD